MENMDKGLTVSKWVLINWPKIPPECPKMYLPKLSGFGISMKKKASLGVRNPWYALVTFLCVLWRLLDFQA